MAASRTPTIPSAKNLISIKRIGEIGAAVLLITIVNTGSFAKRGHLAAFLGMTLGASQSNDSMRVGRTTKRRSEIVRTTLVQCASVAKHYSPLPE